MDEQEITETDMTALERSATSRAVALARLLHRDCNRLLQLYKERESFLSDHTPEGGRLVTLSACLADLSTAEQVWHLCSALRRCLELLECLIGREVEEHGEDAEGEYEEMRRAVRERLSHLLHSTGALLQDGEAGCKPIPEHVCSEGMDEVEGSGSFAGKLWTFKVLLELIHWTDTASQTLHVFHSEREAQEEEQEL